MQLFAICDDEKNICSQLEATLINILDKLNLPYEIDVFQTGFELYEKLKQGYSYDLLFLDVGLVKDKLNGIQLGYAIRDLRENNSIPICFISWEPAHALDLFDIQPINFLIKPLSEVKIEKTIKKVIKQLPKQSPTLSYKISHQFYKCPLKNILYLESQGRKIIIHLTDGTTEEFYGKLKDIYTSQLEVQDFLYIHASYTVNPLHVKKFQYEEIIMTNGKELPISQARRAKIRERTMEMGSV